jgi:hypothetical protein
MAAKKGDGLLMVYCDVAAEHEAEFNRWYNEVHVQGVRLNHTIFAPEERPARR